MVPLRTQLKNGDIVEIVTSQGRRPSRDWLSFVVTSRARNKIRHFINAEEKTRATEIGRKLLEREARRCNIKIKSKLTGQSTTRLAAEYGFPKIEELYAKIGYGKVAARHVLGKLVPESDLPDQMAENGVSAPPVANAQSSKERITVRGFDDLLVFRARCCNPIRDESIVGYITRGKGVSVHATDCPNVLNLLYDPERRIDVVWDRYDDPTPYIVHLAIQIEDRQGILADVSARITNIDTNIKNIEATTSDDQQGRINVTVEVRNVEHLQRVLESLRGVTGVIDVERAAG